MLANFRGKSRVVKGNKPNATPEGFNPPILHHVTGVPLAGTGLVIENPSRQKVPDNVNASTGKTLAGLGPTTTVVTASKNDVSDLLPNIIPANGRVSRFLGSQWVVLIGLVGAFASVYTLTSLRKGKR